MVTVTKEVTFDCAHMLDGHEGLCRNLHGHTYKVQVTARRSGGFLISKGPAKGMVLDFSALKGIMQAHIVEPFDHAFVYHGGSCSELMNLSFLYIFCTLRLSSIQTFLKYPGANAFRCKRLTP